MDLFDKIGEKQLPIKLPEGEHYKSQLNPEYGGFDIQLLQGEIFFAEKFFDKKVSDRSVEYFQENESVDWNNFNWAELSEEDLSKVVFKNIQWKHDSINMYGKNFLLPRLTSWYGDPGRDYRYSGITSRPNPWNKGLIYIKQNIEKVAGVNFNSVLLNWYRNGEDYLNWHADDEKELGRNPVIASVNFGETRDFVIRRNDDHKTKIVIPLSHGSLLIMRGELQHFWQHSVPKRKKVKGSRFNLTFREID